MKIERNLSFNHVNKLMKLADRAPHVQVGFMGGESYPDRPEITVAMVALWNEYGTDTIPERPFMRVSLRDRTANHMNLIRWTGRRVIKGEITMDAALDIVGKAAVKSVHDGIDDSARYKKNADSTLARKKKRSSKPLIDTGLMRESVTYRKKL